MKGQRERAYDSQSGINVDRRTFMGTRACAGAGMSLGAVPQPAPPAAAPAKAHRATITLYVNGVAHELDLDPRVTLVDALRDRVGLHGTTRAKRVRDLPITPDKLLGA